MENLKINPAIEVIQNEQEIVDYIKRSSKILQLINSDPESDHCNLKVFIDSITLLRNLTIQILTKDEYVQTFISNIFDEKFFIIKSSFKLFGVHIKNLDKDLKNNHVVPDSVLLILRTLQFWHNLLNLKFRNLADIPLSKEFHQILDPTYTFILNIYRWDKFDGQINYYLRRCSIVFSAILYQCLSNEEFLILKAIESNELQDLWDTLFDHITSEISEWSLWILFLCLKREKFVDKLFFSITTQKRIILLDVCMEFIDDECKNHKYSICTEKNEPTQLKDLIVCDIHFFHDGFVVSIMEYFQNEIYSLMEKDMNVSLNENSEETRIYLVCKISAFLLKISSFKKYNNLLKNNEDLFKLLVELLKNLQLLGKTNHNYFGIQGNLGSSEQGDEKIVNNPFYGFKRNLIGLIGNYIFGNSVAQEYLRKSGGLMALLDCTKIDRNNPFIMQWSIFAIRNALERNQTNQKFVSDVLEKPNVFDNELLNKIKFL